MMGLGVLTGRRPSVSDGVAVAAASRGWCAASVVLLYMTWPARDGPEVRW